MGNWRLRCVVVADQSGCDSLRIQTPPHRNVIGFSGATVGTCEVAELVLGQVLLTRFFVFEMLTGLE